MVWASSPPGFLSPAMAPIMVCFFVWGRRLELEVGLLLLGRKMGNHRL